MEPEDHAQPGAEDDGEANPDAARQLERRSAPRVPAGRRGTRRERQVRAGRGFAIVVIVMVAAGVVFRAPESWWVPAVGAAALLGLVFRLVNWKCPNCGERLPTRGSLARCLGCGAPLD